MNERADHASVVARALLWSHVALRIEEPSRRYVPRRLLVPLPGATGLLAVAEGGPTLRLAGPTDVDRAWPDGARRIRLFPGAAADVPSGATVLRGRVVRGGEPVRWARVVARSPNQNGAVECFAHGDDRGEFVLVVPRALDTTTLNLRETWTVSVSVPVSTHAGSDGAPTVPAPRAGDPLDGLPLERITERSPEDRVSAGTQNTDAWGPERARAALIRTGRTTSQFTIEVP